MAELRKLETTKMVGQLVDQYWEDLRNAPKMGKKVAWTCGPPVTQLMFSSQGMAFHYAEPFGAYAAGRHVQAPFLNASENMGIPVDICGYEKVSFGHIQLSRTGQMQEIDPKYDLPNPDFAFTARCCPNHASFVDAVGRIYNVPTIMIDVPIQCLTPTDFEESKAYVKRQIYEIVVPFVEKMLGKKYDFDKFEEMVMNLQKTVEFRRYYIELGKMKPSPLSFFDAVLSIAMVVSLAGKPESVTYSQQLKAELEERVAKGISALSEERFRVYWDHLPIWFKIGYLSKKLASAGINVVAGNYTHSEAFPLYIDEYDNPKDPVDWMAEFLVRNNRSGIPEFKRDWILKTCQDYSIDGAIFHNNRTCRYFDGDTFQSAKDVERQLGIPTVIIDGDTADPQFLSESQMDNRLDAFIEIMEARKAAGG